MQRTIVFLLGTSYSGSSLLNSLLDAQPNTRGLGEAVHLVQRPTQAWCSHCECHVDDCQLQRRVQPSCFYDSVFGVYPETEVLVNSSKTWNFCFQCMPIPAEHCRICVIVLSKSLEEFSHSYSAHHKSDCEYAFNTWLRVYRHLLNNLDRVLTGSPETEVQQQLVGRIVDDNVAYINYRELTTETDATLARLCDQLNLPFDRAYRDRLWHGDTCTIGGNNAIYAQRTHSESFFHVSRDYLNGKYSGRRGRVFYDDHWISNAPLRRAAAAWRLSKQNELDPLERRLRQCPSPVDMSSMIQ